MSLDPDDPRPPYLRARLHTAVGFASLATIALECADPDGLAAFYHQLLGWPITGRHAEYTDISNGHTRIRFARVEGYQPPGWPDTTTTPKRYHLDFDVDDLPEAVDRCLQLGAELPTFQPGGAEWTVLTDPAGHPFCLCRR